jgi:hypothetical protein
MVRKVDPFLRDEGSREKLVESSEELVTDFLTSPPILPKWQRDHGSRNIATNNARTTSQLTVSKLSTMPMIIITVKLQVVH